MLFRELRRERYHLWRIIDRDHFARGFGQQLRERAFARAQIGYGHRRQQRDKGVGERLPRTTGGIAAAKFASQFIEIFARFVLSLAQRQLQRGPIAPGLWNFARHGVHQFLRARPSPVALRIIQAVINFLARPPIDDGTGPFELGQVAGNTRLPHAEDLLKLGYGEFIVLEQEHEAQPGRVGHGAQEING